MTKVKGVPRFGAQLDFSEWGHQTGHRRGLFPVHATHLLKSRCIQEGERFVCVADLDMKIGHPQVDRESWYFIFRPSGLSILQHGTPFAPAEHEIHTASRVA